MNKANVGASLLRRRIFAGAETLAIALVVYYWVDFLVPESPEGQILSIAFALSSGLLFISTAKDSRWSARLSAPTYLGLKIFTLMIFSLFLASQWISPITSIYTENWYAIPIGNWLRLIPSMILCLVIPGLVITEILDPEKILRNEVRVVMYVILSIAFTSLLWYVIRSIGFDANSAPLLFVAGVLVVILFFLKFSSRNDNPSPHIPRRIDLWTMVVTGSLIWLSVSFVFVEQFLLNPFLRGDNLAYLVGTNYVSKGLSELSPIGKFYSLGPENPFGYIFFISALTQLSGFAPANLMMLISIIIAALLPLAFLGLCFQCFRESRISLLSSFLYIASSGFGWIPFLHRLLSSSNASSSVVSFFDSISPKVINDVTQPHGAIPEGFKTYVLALLSLLLIIYLLQSDISISRRLPFLVILSTSAFLFHIEEALILPWTFLPAYVLTTKQEAKKVVSGILAIGGGIMSGILILSTLEPTYLKNWNLEIVVTALSVAVLIAIACARNKTKLNPILSGVPIRRIAAPVVVYLYIISSGTLAIYGYANMNYGGLVVYSGYPVPWYYFPMSLGVVGLLCVIGAFMDYTKSYRGLSFYIASLILLLIFGRVISLLNVYWFFTGAKEWRILYRLVPIPASVFGGLVLFRLMKLLKKLAPIVLLTIIILGIPSTALAARYWMMTDNTSLGRIYATADDIEMSNLIYNVVPIDSRIAVVDPRSSIVAALGGGPVAFRTNYPDFGIINRPETLALLSSDVSYILTNKYKAQTINALSDLLLILPVVANTSNYVLYRLPSFRSPSASNIGYLAPRIYSSSALLSYIIIASTNSSYAIVSDEFVNKSALLLPFDLPITQKYVLNLTGRHSYVNLGDKLDLGAGDLTLEIWFKASTTDSIMSLINKRVTGFNQPGYRVVIKQGMVQAELNEGAGTVAAAGPAPLDNTWHQLVVTYDRNYGIKLYIDGIPLAYRNFQFKSRYIDTSVPLTLGSENGTALFFKGSISNFRAYDRVLSNSEILTNLFYPANPILSGLVAWYPLDEGAGSVVHDVVNVTGRGTVVGAQWDYDDVPVGLYNVSPDAVLRYITGGGSVVVFGGSGQLFQVLGLQYGRIVNANSITVAGKALSLGQNITLRLLNLTKADAKPIAFYSFANMNASPFIIEKALGNGRVVYVYKDPLAQIRGVADKASYLSGMIRDLLREAGINMSMSQPDISRFPMQNRWITKYPAYGQVPFSASGRIQVSAQASGSNLLNTRMPVVQFNDKQVNITINEIEINGTVDVYILSSKVEAGNSDTIPPYLPLKFEDSIMTLKPTGYSTITIKTSQGINYVSNSTISLKAPVMKLVLREPFVTISGNARFTKISVPNEPSPWLNQVELSGVIRFHIGYSDANYVFFDEFNGSYTIRTKNPFSDVKESLPTGVVAALYATPLVAAGYWAWVYRYRAHENRTARREGTP